MLAERILYESDIIQRLGALENIRQFKFDHHLAVASDAWFHGDQIDMRVGTVQVANGQSSEILRCWLSGSRDPIGKWIGKRGLSGELWGTLRNVANKRGNPLILLRRNIESDLYVGNMNRYPLEHWVVPVPGYLEQFLHLGRLGIPITHVKKLPEAR